MDFIASSKSMYSTPNDCSNRSYSRQEKTRSSDDILNLNVVKDIKQAPSKKWLTIKKKAISKNKVLSGNITGHSLNNVKPNIPRDKLIVPLSREQKRGRQPQNKMTRNQILDIVHTNSQEFHSLRDSKNVENDRKSVKSKIVFNDEISLSDLSAAPLTDDKGNTKEAWSTDFKHV
jgi:hypothetical protein